MTSHDIQASASETLSGAPPRAQREGITLRVVVLCLALAVAFGYLVPIIDLVTRNTFLGATHLPPGAIAVLLALVLGINPLLKLLRARPFSANESLTVYISCLFSCLVPGHGGENFFIVNVIGPFYYATQEKGWLSFLEPSLRPWMTPALSVSGTYDEAARGVVGGWFNGLQAGQTIPWHAWMVPLVLWGLFIAALYIMLACLAVILRAQWVEREALAFPLLKLPLEMVEASERRDTVSFWRNNLTWCGVGLAVFIQLVNGLHTYFPDVPEIPLVLMLNSYFSEPPWNQLGWVPAYVWPFAVGIAALLTTEISFSLWFFYWFIRAQLIGAYLLGFAPATLPSLMGGPSKTFDSYQVVGCYLAYAAVVVWTGREHLAFVARRGLGRVEASSGEKSEALSYPVAFWGFVASFGFLLSWSVAAGVNLPLALAMWTLYLVIAIGLTRVIVEGGLLFVQQGWVPLGALGQIFGSGPGHWLLSDKSLPSAGMIQGSLMSDLRGFLLPSFLHGFKLATDRKIPQRPLLALIGAVTLVTLVMGFWQKVRLGYLKDGLSLDPWQSGPGSQIPVTSIVGLMNGARDASIWNLGWVALGAALVLGLMFVRSRSARFPLHPLGLLVCLTYPMHTLWFSIFLGWMTKTLLLKYGGAENARKATPFFLGLALGDVMMMVFWLIVDGFFGRTGHKLMPG